jgi:hypothetical protein
MRVEARDGRCRECGGRLTIIAADDATMTVECDDGHLYSVEPDAFGDGCLIYYFDVLMANLGGSQHDGS